MTCLGIGIALSSGCSPGSRDRSVSRLVLAIECATSIASVALMRGGELACEERAPNGRHHAETLLPLVDAVLARGAVSLEAIEGFAVSVGPGAFTSLRVGIASVKGLVFGVAVPVAPVSTLEALALEVSPSTRGRRPVAALLDARREEVYAGLYGAGQEGFREGVYGAEELASRLPEDCVLVGSGAERYASLVAAGSNRELRSGCVPRARWVGALGLEGLARGEGVPAADLVPRYLRRSSAEVQRSISQRA